MRPRVWLVPYLRGWSYDADALGIAGELASRFDIRIAYQDDVDDDRLRAWQPHAVVDFWWRGKLRFPFLRRCLKQISTHRWRAEKHTPRSAIRSYAAGGGGVVVPSIRLLRELEHGAIAEGMPLGLAPKGFDPAVFGDHDTRCGAPVIGWAGDASATDKRVEMLLAAAPDLRLADKCLTPAEMPDFYNALDVVAIASTAEGDPRILIEGMACGCFPVTTDVGIVPELVRNGENGLIVEPTSEAFAAAFAWCRENIGLVRAAGRRNAARMARERTWKHVAPAWSDAISRVIAASN